jgi:hypothetical protein
VVLAYYGGYTHREIAELLGCRRGRSGRGCATGSSGSGTTWG